MGFRDFVEKAGKQDKLVRIKKPVSRRLEASGILAALQEKPVLFEKMKESCFRVAGNLCTSKEAFADYLGIKPSGLVQKMIDAIEHPTKPKVVTSAACQEVNMPVDLDKLPILFHCEKDGGNYISSGVFVIKKPNGVQNLDFHRCMQIGKNRFTIRVVANRDLDNTLKAKGEIDAAVCVGASPAVLLAASISVPDNVDEMGIANALEPTPVVKAKNSDLLIPADCEFILEGKILKERAPEGPFVDLTETNDVIRQEPVFEVRRITHRKEAIWHALLPGKLEHKILMGMPREPTIFRRVNEAGVKCLDVSVNPGGCSWLHGIVQIDKRHEDDGKKAIEAAFEGHKSMKHVFIVDKDIDIFDPMQVEWSMATRFQAHKNLIIREKQKGSSLDPSSEQGTHETTKAGFDLTGPASKAGTKFERAQFPKVDVNKFLE